MRPQRWPHHDGVRAVSGVHHDVPMHRGFVRPAGIRLGLVRTYADLERNHTMQMAAALSYYFVLSLFPALIFLSAVVAYLPVPNLFNQGLGVMARFLPPDSMGLVQRVLDDVLRSD